MTDSGRTRFGFRALVVLGCFAVPGAARGFEWNQENTCVLLNECNADPLTQPADCSLPENLSWCNCLRTVLTNPIRGAASGIEQGVMWITGKELATGTNQPGIGNVRSEVNDGTLDISALQVGDLIGGCLVEELIPEGAGFPPGAKLYVRGETRVTAAEADHVDFEVRIVEYNTFTRLVLTYDPKDAAHSNGLLYRGRATTRGAGNGFVLEYRYESDPGKYAALEAGDAVAPGFNVRFVLSFFAAGTPGSQAYSVPDAPAVEVLSTIRKFRDANNLPANPDEILPLGDEDLCKVIPDGEPEPCKSFEDLIGTSAPGGNHLPTADICVTDPINLGPISTVVIECGEGRAILRGSNSSDNDGGSQGLTYLWEITSGPAGGAEIPPDDATFKDAEISIFLPGRYTVRLTVDDGQPTANTDSQEVTIMAEAGAVTDNLPPEITRLQVTPDPPEVELSGGVATVVFHADANTGPDGCLQTLTLTWESISGPAPVSFSDANDNDTDATFTASGEYLIRLTVDDGAPADNIASQEVNVIVTSRGNTFQRCDANGDGEHNISDAIYTLNHLFLGGPGPACRQSANCNGDASVDISDGIFSLNFLFIGGTSPTPPYPGCDTAETDCDISTPCSAGA